MLSCFSPSRPCWGLNRILSRPGKRRATSSRAPARSGPTLGAWLRSPSRASAAQAGGSRRKISKPDATRSIVVSLQKMTISAA